MIPILFESTYPNTSRTFSGHGIGDLIDATEVLAEENAEDGHEWELTFNYPVTGELFNEIVLERIVLAKVNTYQPLQAFRIYSITKNINQTISVACQHISYDLANIPVKPMKSVGAGPALVDLKTNMLNVCNRDNFIFSTNLPTPTPGSSSAEKKDVTVEFEEPRNALKVLFDGDDSIHGKYGGDVIVNNYDISILEIGGSDRGIEITYGVDLVDLDQERNISNMVTGILPYYVRAKDTRLDIDLEQPSTVTEVNASMANNAAAYTLEVGSKYTLKFTPENTGGSAKVTSGSGFGEHYFNMDGNEKEYEIIPSSSIIVPVGTSLVSCVSLPANDEMGSIRSFSIVKNYIEPIIYGDLTNGPGVYNVPKIEPVDLSEYFQDSNIEPTVTQINTKAAEWVAKEEIGQPEVSLTVSYASLEGKDIRLHDAVRVRFPKLGVDVKSKVTRYKYDVITERCTEIDVGKTKDSAIFTLQDASRLRKGLLPPDRIAKESVSGDKIKKGSIGSNEIGKGAISKWNMPNDIIDKDLLGEKAVGVLNLKTDDGTHPAGWKSDPVLKTVPDNVHGGYEKSVGYLFDPSMGVPPDNLFGWTYRNATTGDETFHPITKWQQNIPYDEHGSGVGYVLDPNFILDNDVSGTKIQSDSISGDKLLAGSIDETKLSTEVDPSTGKKNLKSKITAWENLYDNVGPEMESAYAASISGSSYMAYPFLAVSRQFYITGGDIAVAGGPGGLPYHISPHTITVQQGGQTLAVMDVLSDNADGNLTIVLPTDNSSHISSIDASITSLRARTTNIENDLYSHSDPVTGEWIMGISSKVDLLMSKVFPD